LSEIKLLQLERRGNLIVPTVSDCSWQFAPTKEDTKHHRLYELTGYDVCSKWDKSTVLWHFEFNPRQVAATRVMEGTFTDRITVSWAGRGFFEIGSINNNLFTSPVIDLDAALENIMLDVINIIESRPVNHFKITDWAGCNG
jgi:hypothetical protein